jgi:hypothetical protein
LTSYSINTISILLDERKRSLPLYRWTAAYASLLPYTPYPGGCFLLRMALATSCAMVNAAV